MKVTLSIATSPLAGSHLLTAICAPENQVLSVKFYVDGVLKATDSSTPYTYLWDTKTVPDGVHYVEATASFDKSRTASDKKQVTVKNAITPPPPPPIQAPPVNTVLPTIAGTTTVGQTLSVSDGTWTNSPTSYSRQWMRCDAAGANGLAIPGAVGASYQLVAADVGKTIRCVVIASNNLGPGPSVQTTQTAVVDALTPAVPVLVTTPTITGTPVVGNTLAVSNGSWTNSPTDYTHCWDRCDASGANCVDIPGQDCASYNPQYVLTSADAGKTIKCWTTAINATGNSTPVLSAATTVVQSAPAPPPPPPPSATLVLDSISDLAGVQNASGFSEFSTPLGSGFKAIASAATPKPGSTSEKTCFGIYYHTPQDNAVGKAERWSFSVYIPTQTLAQQWSAGLIFQFHTHSFTEPFWPSSGHHLSINSDGTWRIGRQSGAGGTYDYPVGGGAGGPPVAFNTWIPIVIEVNWQTGASGYLRVWIGGSQKLNYTGPTVFSDEFPYVQFGWMSVLEQTNEARFSPILMTRL